MRWRYRAQAEPTLDGVSLAVRRGEKVAIVGRSGSGKSTLVQLVNGLIPHRVPGELSGEALIAGAPHADRRFPEISDLVGTVLQDTDAQFVGLTVAEDLAFALENARVPVEEMRARVAELARTVRMSDRLDAEPRELSGGQRQRVSMGGVLGMGAELLVFDEPLASLDPQSGRRSVELIDELWRAGRTVVIVEHRLEEFLHRPVDRIILMDGGRIVADAPPAELIASGELARRGIREPLSVAALRYAGVELRPEQGLGEPDRLELDAAACRALARWAAEEVPPLPERPAPAGAPLLRLRGVEAERGGRPVLRGIDLELGAGALVALCGPNGAGKSTLAGVLCGFVDPCAGTIELAGEDLAGRSIAERGRRIGYVLQNPNEMLSQHLVRDEVALGIDESDPDAVERIDAALRVCGLWARRSWPISALSYGQCKRLTIAAMLAREPAMLILDEPTAGQDLAHADDFMELIAELAARGTLVLLVTHDVHLALEYATRALVLGDGRIIADGEPAEVFADPEALERGALHPTSLVPLAERIERELGPQLGALAGADAGEPFAVRLHRRFIRADRAARAERAASRASEGASRASEGARG